MNQTRQKRLIWLRIPGVLLTLLLCVGCNSTSLNLPREMQGVWTTETRASRDVLWNFLPPLSLL